MTTEIDTENELRRLFAEIPAPAPPATWRPVPGVRPTRRSRRGTRRTHWLAPRVLVAVPALALVIAGVFLARREITPAPRPFSGLTVAALPGAAGLSCSLPISALSQDHTTGFVTLSNGSAHFTAVQTDGTTYIPALGRWADVLPQMVSPDGRWYVTQDYRSGQTVLSVVDAAGARTVLSTSAPINIFAVATEGILVDDMSPQPGQEGPPPTLNLRVLDPATGSLRPLPFAAPLFPSASGGSGAGYLRSGNAVWITAYDTTSNRSLVDRYDLATGVTTRWFDGSRDGHGDVQVVGADSQGDPIIQLSTTDLFHTNPANRAGIGVQTMLLSAPHAATVLNGGRVGDAGVAGDLSPLSVTDGGLVWLAADDGAIWLYRPASGLSEIAKVSTSTSGAPGVSVSGPCR